MPRWVAAAGSSPLTRGARHHPLRSHRAHRIIPAHAGGTPTSCAPWTSTRDHPRSRGGHIAAMSELQREIGSSPLTRGAHPLSRGEQTPLRIIPAHAGGTRAGRRGGQREGDHPRSRGGHTMAISSARSGSGSSPLTRGAPRTASTSGRTDSDHPRSRGGHCAPVPERKIVAGSSPLTRGAHEEPPVVGLGPRIIPAHAGGTARQPSPPRSAPDHPRSRGGHSHTAQTVAPVQGSSPLTRGALKPSELYLMSDWIIPAHAGGTPYPLEAPPREPDHPRSRGGHSHTAQTVAPVQGSSPLTRGALKPSELYLMSDWIIPAHAGGTPYPLEAPPREPDHPRSRGGHSHTAQTVAPVQGSSPLTRGALKPSELYLMSDWIIPAHAGGTPYPLEAPPREPDHPRSRGGHCGFVIILLITTGSSPLTRGAQVPVVGHHRRMGIIPAHAGGTGRWWE